MLQQLGVSWLKAGSTIKALQGDLNVQNKGSGIIITIDNIAVVSTAIPGLKGGTSISTFLLL